MCALLMLRRLLTCLALLTGLAAAGAPAQAEVVAALASRMEASAAGEAVSHRSSVVIVAPLPSTPEAVDDMAVAPLSDRVVHVPAVLVEIDRARA